MQVAKLQKKVAEAVRAHKTEEARADTKRKEHAGAQKTALQLDKKAGKRQRDADAAVDLCDVHILIHVALLDVHFSTNGLQPAGQSKHAILQNLALQLDKKAGKRQRDTAVSSLSCFLLMRAAVRLECKHQC